jgi:hypothetical protein
MAVDDAEDDQLASMSTEDIVRASRLLDNEIRVLKVSEPSPRSDPLWSAPGFLNPHPALGSRFDSLGWFCFWWHAGRAAADEPGAGVGQGEDQGEPGED